MLNTKYCFRFYSDYDVKGMTGFLDRMAAKGWLLSKKSGVYYKFVKTDKSFIKYNITYFADANKENDFYPYGADRYFEMRQEAGWQFLTNDRKMMIFISEAPDAVELETEPMIKVDVIHQSYTHLYLFIELWMLLPVLSAFLRLADNFSDYGIIIRFGDCLLCGVGIIVLNDILSYFIWYFKAKKAAKEGWFYQTKTPFLKLYVMPVIFWWMVITLLSIPVLSIVI